MNATHPSLEKNPDKLNSALFAKGNNIPYPIAYIAYFSSVVFGISSFATHKKRVNTLSTDFKENLTQPSAPLPCLLLHTHSCL